MKIAILAMNILIKRVYCKTASAAFYNSVERGIKMSFLNIPDINPCINITSEDAINLLLTSIAMEEVSLSKLMDAETNKILCVLDNCRHHDNYNHNNCNHNNCSHNNSLLHDTIEINKSVDGTIIDMIKLQMLLQFKLDKIIEFLPSTSSTTTMSTSTSTTTSCTKTTTTKTTSSTTTTTHTTTCSTSTCSTTTKKECYCSLTGKGKGCVTNCHDEFYKNTATLYSFIYCSGTKNRTIRYCVENKDARLRMCAMEHNVNIQNPSICPDKLTIYGKGYAQRRSLCNPDISGRIDYILTVCKKTPYSLEFRMEIKSETNQKLNHDSGFVHARSSISGLQLIIFC